MSFPLRPSASLGRAELELLGEQLLDDEWPGPSGSVTNARSISPRASGSSNSASEIVWIICSCARVVDREAPHQRTGHEAAEALEDPDAHHTCVPLAERVHLTLRHAKPREDPARLFEHDLAGGRGRHALEPLRPDDEPLADDPLERRDLLADRRLRVAELPGGLVEPSSATASGAARCRTWMPSQGATPTVSAQPVAGHTVG